MADETTYPFTMWRWRILDPVRKRRFTTSYLMTEAEALAKDPTAEKAPDTARVITGPSAAPRLYR